MLLVRILKTRAKMTNDWSKLKAFYHSAVSGSFTAAAEKIFVTQPSISKKITTLEENLGVLLFNRTPKGLVLTTEGNILFKAVQKMSTIYKEMETNLKDNSDKISRTFSIAIVPHLLSSSYFIQVLSKFKASYPNIKISIQNSSQGWISGVDVAIAPINQVTDNLFYDPILTLKPLLWAGKEYYEKYLQNTNDSLDLAKHQLIAYSSHFPYSRIYNWHTYQENKFCEKNIVLWLPSVDDVINAVSQNFGISSFPKEFIPQHLSDKLVCLNKPNSKIHTVDLYYIYPIDHANSEKIKAIGTYLSSNFEKNF